MHYFWEAYSICLFVFEKRYDVAITTVKAIPGRIQQVKGYIEKTFVFAKQLLVKECFQSVH